MSNSLEFILKLTDKLTPGMRQAASISNTAANQIESQFTKIGSSGKRMNASVNELRSRLEAVNKVRFGSTLEREFNIATRSAQKLESQISKLENKGNSSNFIGSLISTAGIAYGARDVIKTGIEQRQVSGAINFATQGHGMEAMGQAKGINNKYGLDDEAGMQGLKTVTGSTRGLGYSLQQQMDIYEGVGTGVAAMGLSADAAKLSFMALGQMASKGKISAEELRGQLGEHIPGALGIASRAMGVSQENFNKMLDTGQIMAKDFLPKFAAQMKNEFGPAALAMATGPQAELNRFNNKLIVLKKTFSDQLIPALMPALTILKDLLDWFVKNNAIMVPLSMGIAGVVLAVNAWTLATKAATFFTGAWTVVSNILNASLWANPVTWIVIGIISLIAIIGSLIYMFDGWGKTWSNLIKFCEHSWAAYKGTFLIVWLEMQNAFLTGIELIERAWYKLKNLWDEDGATAGLSKINSQQNLRAAEIAYAKGVLTSDLKAAGSAMKWEITRNDKGPAKIISDLKMKFGVSSGVKTTSPLGTTNNSAGIKGTGFLGGREKAESINNGGQRSIVINIGKQVEIKEQHIHGGGKEVANDIEQQVRESMRRVLYSINGIAS